MNSREILENTLTLPPNYFNRQVTYVASGALEMTIGDEVKTSKTRDSY